MLLHEPPRTRYDLHFVMAGVPVRVHPFFWLVALALSLQGGVRHVRWEDVVIWIGVLFVSILVHEFGHALAYRRFNYEPHIILHWLGGLAAADMTYAVQPPRGQRKIIISLAGPAAGFVLAAATIGVLYLVGRRIDFFFGWQIGRGDGFTNPNLRLLCFSLLEVNILWGLMNLLPVFPLDGGQIAREVAQTRIGREGVLLSLKLSMGVGILAAVGFLAGLGTDDGLFPALLFGSLAFGNFQEIKFLQAGGGYGPEDDDEGESWRRGRGDREW